MTMGLFSRNASTLPDPPKIEIVNPQSADEQCETCHRYITVAHTPEAQDIEHDGIKHTYCGPACVPPSLIKAVLLARQQSEAQREVAAREAAELAKQNRILNLQNQIAYINSNREVIESLGLNFVDHLKQFTDALQAEMTPGNTSPHMVIPLEPSHQFV